MLPDVRQLPDVLAVVDLLALKDLLEGPFLAQRVPPVLQALRATAVPAVHAVVLGATLTDSPLAVVPRTLELLLQV